jgi:hypothetical protein
VRVSKKKMVMAPAAWAVALTISAGSYASEIPPDLVPLLESKEKFAAEFAAQIAMCSSRKDNDYPVFKGCIDWHSAVHGMWALLAFERATGNHQYSSLVAGALTESGLAHEREHLKENPGFEMPYGRSWFLRLAIEYGTLTGSPKLQGMADEVAFSIRDHFRKAKIQPLSGAYDSASWALINLLDYARYRQLPELQTEVEGWVTEHFVSGNLHCPWRAEEGEFMAVCTNRAALVARVMDHENYNTWLDKFIEINGIPEPIKPDSPHSYGLNFSRAWGLWDMYDKSGRADLAAAYAAHFDHGFNPTSNWKGSYRVVGHWVAQFGMFALQPLFGRTAGR